MTSRAGADGSRAGGLPEGRRSASAFAFLAGAPPPDAPVVHIVKRGETLPAIAHGYGVNLRELAALNRI
ncbi:MAG: LysM peptidoglycan-binding domain-containing protein, partial [Candidatus Aminicenantes bacterium]|nr:LysM peptidoglycan-binding domain-containing protein [Candidatus Aminicenantes bacterium]